MAAAGEREIAASEAHPGAVSKVRGQGVNEVSARTAKMERMRSDPNPPPPPLAFSCSDGDSKIGSVDGPSRRNLLSTAKFNTLQTSQDLYFVRQIALS